MPCDRRVPALERLASSFACAAALAMVAEPAAAQSWWRPDGMHLELGRSTEGAAFTELGLRWEWDWQRPQWGGRFSGGTELSMGYWSARLPSGREAQPHLGLTPLLRWRPSQGASPWFIEGGIGLSYHAHPERANETPLSTHWNFYDVLALGYSVARDDDVSLRAVHISNGGLRRPNPGTNLVVLRWARRF